MLKVILDLSNHNMNVLLGKTMLNYVKQMFVIETAAHESCLSNVIWLLNINTTLEEFVLL